MIHNDATLLGLLLVILATIFYTASLPNCKPFYKVVPPLILCYLIPGLLNSFGIINASESQLYAVVSKYLLPPCLVLFTLGLDWSYIRKLGSKAVIATLAGTAGIIIGGPLALWIVGTVNPSVVSGQGADAVWRGLATLAGSWIGGGANQAALKEVFLPSDRLYSQIIAVDVVIAELWMALLIYGAGMASKMNRLLGFVNKASDEMHNQLIPDTPVSHQIPIMRDLIYLAAVSFGASGFAYWIADGITPYISNNYPNLAKFSLTSTFFWVVTISTAIGILLSGTSIRKLENVGASKMATVFLYLLVTTIGMQMDLKAVADNPGLFSIGIIWILTHALILFSVCKWLKIPFFFMAVGSQANVGGTASASIVAASFHPSLAPVGVLLAILGYAIGTYGGYITALMMQWVSEGF